MGVQAAIDGIPSTSPWTLLQVDLWNAYNSVHRAAVVGALEELSPALLPWTRFCLQPAPLFCGGMAIMSTRGVQQGDPLGPLVFAAALIR